MSNLLQTLLKQMAFWESEKFPKMLATMTDDQKRAYLDPKNCVLMEGGNQSGKSRTAVLKVCGFALEDPALGESCFPGKDVNIWYTTTTYDKFGEQAWGHFKNALLFEGESVTKLPTFRVESINWLGKSPEKPSYFCVKRPSGAKAHIYVHSYAQGRGEFQGQTVNLAVVDEECPEDIFNEIRARMFACEGSKLLIACTPVEGEPWLDAIRDAAEDSTYTSKYRFKTLDNPTVNRAVIDEMTKQLKNCPEELQLRLLGIPIVGSTLVFNDKAFTPDHIINQSQVDLTHWTLNRAIDAGYRHPACVWIAVSPDEKQIVVYRAWKGKDLTIAEAAKEIKRLSGVERYYWDIIDPAVCQTNAETGQPELAVWRSNGIDATPAPDNTVRSGIERVHILLGERVEIPARDGQTCIERPRFRVIRETCQEWLDERRRYRFKDMIKEVQRDLVDFRPVKQNDHLMDPTRYLVSAGLRYVPEQARAPRPGTQERMWWDMRHKKEQKRKR